MTAGDAPTREIRLTARPAPVSVAAPLLALLAGCTSTSMELREPTLPAPLLEPIPARVGIKYSPEMHDFTHREELLANRAWTISLGAANRLLYDQIFTAMFDEVVFLEEEDDPRLAGIDYLIRPSVEAFEFALPEQSRSETYTVWIRYRLRVFDDAGDEIGNWPVSAYGKAGAGRFEGSKALQRAAALAMRDAAALVSMRFAKEIGFGGEAEGEAAPAAEQLAESDTAAAAPAAPENGTVGGAPAAGQPASEKFRHDPG